MILYINIILNIIYYMNNKYSFFENKILGKGLTSIVCEGIENKTKEIVAVKIISKVNKINKIKNFNKYITNEINILNFLNSNTNTNSNIIKLLDVEENDERYVLVFDYAPIKFEKIIHYIPYDKIFYYLIQLLEILILLKNNNILHNDIKPANILIKDDKIKLCDFGMAEFLEENVDSIDGIVCGSPMYMNLSKINGTHSYDTDFWCFKLIYYEMVYKQHPFNKIKNTKDLKIKLENLDKDLYKNISFYSDYDIHTKILKKLFANEIKTPLELLETINKMNLETNKMNLETNKINLETNKINLETNNSNEDFSFSEILDFNESKNSLNESRNSLSESRNSLSESKNSLSAIKISNEVSIFNMDDCNQFILI